MNTQQKIIAWLALFSGLAISGIAIFYSVIGLASIFAAAALPVIIMGTILEVSKLVATVWLKANWNDAPRLIKYYLTTAVIVLMLITSMGIFGFLSKAHLDQSVPTGDVVAKLSLIDEKIKNEKENINEARRTIAQLDRQVDETISRTAKQDNNAGVNRSISIRRAQSKERTQLAKDIEASQAKITKLNEERAPIASEVRKVEAEVGPIKYIAAFVYGQTSEDVLEKAVTWVILILVVVFDPLAVILLLASQHSLSNKTQLPPQREVVVVEEPEEEVVEGPDEAERIRIWKEANPNGSVKMSRAMFKAGTIKKLPWN